MLRRARTAPSAPERCSSPSTATVRLWFSPLPPARATPITAAASNTDQNPPASASAVKAAASISFAASTNRQTPTRPASAPLGTAASSSQTPAAESTRPSCPADSPIPVTARNGRHTAASPVPAASVSAFTDSSRVGPGRTNASHQPRAASARRSPLATASGPRDEAALDQLGQEVLYHLGGGPRVQRIVLAEPGGDLGDARPAAHHGPDERAGLVDLVPVVVGLDQHAVRGAPGEGAHRADRPPVRVHAAARSTVSSNRCAVRAVDSAQPAGSSAAPTISRTAQASS